jgi:UPF0716 protein FxsA
MPLLLFLAFVGVPILEIALFIQVGGAIGLGWTLALVIATALLGTMLLRAQGLATMGRARASLDRGEVPMREVFDGACLLVGGALLLTPGFATDTVGFLLLLPPVRTVMLSRLRQSGRFHVHTAQGGMAGGMAGGFGARPGPGDRPGGAPVIDGEFEEVGPPRPTRWGGTAGRDDDPDEPESRP